MAGAQQPVTPLVPAAMSLTRTSVRPGMQLVMQSVTPFSQPMTPLSGADDSLALALYQGGRSG